MKRYKCVAYHEAGHTVAHAVLFNKFFGAEISGSSGHFLGGRMRVSMTDQYTRWSIAAQCLAGPYAEAKASKKCRLWVCVGQEDMTRAKEILAWLVEKGFSDSMEAAWDRAEALTLGTLREHWSSIDRVATALLKHGKIGAVQVRELIRTTTTNHPSV